jgi:DNA-binding response OmpR family regulator
MLTRTRRHAEVQIIHISDDGRDVKSLAKTLYDSRYRVYLSSLSSSPLNVVAVWRSVFLQRLYLPTAILIDYFCDGGRCEDILRDLRRRFEKFTVEVIIYNAPRAEETRDALLALGANTIIWAETLGDRTRVARCH